MGLRSDDSRAFAKMKCLSARLTCMALLVLLVMLVLLLELGARMLTFHIRLAPEGAAAIHCGGGGGTCGRSGGNGHAYDVWYCCCTAVLLRAHPQTRAPRRTA